MEIGWHLKFSWRWTDFTLEGMWESEWTSGWVGGVRPKPKCRNSNQRRTNTTRLSHMVYHVNMGKT